MSNQADFQPPNPDYAARVRDSFSRQGAMALIGAELSRLGPGACEIRLPYRPELSQQHGYFHGGIIGTIADSAGGYAAFTLMPADSSVLTVEYKMNLLAPGDGEALIARGRVLKAGRSLVVVQVDVAALKAGRETHCATSLQTLMTMHGKPDQRRER
ncbi:MAG: PaaI family thioesterase [Gammaproteobacteria bacterium]